MASTDSITVGERTISPGDQFSDTDRKLVFDRAELDDDQLSLVFRLPNEEEEVRYSPIEFLHNF